MSEEYEVVRRFAKNLTDTALCGREPGELEGKAILAARVIEELLAANEILAKGLRALIVFTSWREILPCVALN